MGNVDAKDLYVQTGELFRHYLIWREKLLGGYLVVIAGLAVAVNVPRDPIYFRSGVAILGAVLTVVFWLLDRRNRALFHECLRVGANLEPQGPAGPFTQLNKLDAKWYAPTHGMILSCFFSLAIVTLVSIAVYFWPR